jgi:ribosomal protein S12 methylthiotransferase accessory factor
VSTYMANIQLLYDAKTVQLAEQLLKGEVQYFGLNHLGDNMEGSVMHQQLLAAYEKVRVMHKA